ncbi:MAG: Na+/H+ antiporter NhaA, partial [Actinomycetota bacterium]|nr:Na+/H+ antiporter NhaA [Actinomycetota bacterium]
MRGAGRYWQDERRSGMLLAVAAVVAVTWASSPWRSGYESVWGHPAALAGVGSIVPDVRGWVDDGAMTVFFLVVGLEIGRERHAGLLASWRRAVVPVAAAAGGMAGAALAYAAVVHGGAGTRGWGVPMATDIALVAGAAAVLGDRVPAGLRLFLVTLAVADDVGSVAVLAVVSGTRVAPVPLAAAAAMAAVLVAGRGRWRSAWPVVLAVVPMWLALARGGVEPSLAGVLAGVLAPVCALVPGSRPARLSGPRLERALHPVSALFVLPLFALANVGVDIRGPLLAAPGTVGVFAGVVVARVVGKPVGIVLGGLGGARAVRVRRPGRVGLGGLAGGSALAGAGFTVPLLFAAVAFGGEPRLFAAARAGLLAGSVASAAIGAAILSALRSRSRSRSRS